MQKDNLTLRNLYNFLMIRDYPIYSTGIIGNEQKKGITLSKFWRDTLLPEFTGGKYGKMIWKNTGSRNRHTSEICNRSSQLTVYDEYMEELTGLISEEVILRQIGLFGVFLVNHQFSYKVFIVKLKALLDKFANEDTSFGEDIRAYFRENLKWTQTQEILEKGDEEFVAGWFLTFLALHALTGDSMNSVRMQALRSNPDYGIKTLWEKSHQSIGKRKITFLTTESCEICSKALPADHFWGRESEQFALREMMKKGGHYVLSGIGGTGKTELLRQFLQYCVKNNVVEYVCVIQYENDFAESLLRAFASRQTGSFEESFQEVMGELKRYCAHNKVLILIDNIGKTTEEDPYLKVLDELSANIFATSRLASIEGFETYKINELDLKSCNLVFRDNYKFILEKEELLRLEALLNNPIYRHTLTLRLLGQFAGSMGWSLDELIGKLGTQDEPVLNKEEEKWLGLRRIYAQLYSKYGLKENQKEFLRIVAVLPYRKYPVGFLNMYMGYMMDNSADFVQTLGGQGWLEMNEQAVSMHPVIAESILDKPVSGAEVYQLYREIASRWTSEFGDLTELECRERMLGSEDADFIRSSELVMDVLFKVSFSVADEWIPLVVLAAEIVKRNFSLAPNRVRQIKEMVQNAKQIPDEVRIRGYQICSDILAPDIALLEKEIEKQDKCRTVSEVAYHRLVNVTASVMLDAGEIKKAEVLLQKEKESECKAEEVNRCYLLGLLTGLQVRLDESFSWNEKGIKAAEHDKKKYRDELFLLWGSQLAMCNGTKRVDEGAECLRQMEVYMKKDNVLHSWYYNFYKGTYCYQIGRMEEAAECIANAIEYAGYYFGKDHINYAMGCEDLAMAQGKLKRFEEAEKNHKTAMELLGAHAEFALEKGRVLNNMAVMYLDWGRTEQALSCSKEAFEIGEKNNDLSMAEPAFNIAKCYRALKDTDKELEYLNKAYPVFEKFYTAAAEKTRQAKERIEELTK